MRRTLPFVALWFAAGALAAAVASAGVAVVNDQLTSPRPSPLSAQEVQDELAAADGTTTTEGAASPTSTTTPRPTAATTTTAPRGTGTTDGTDGGSTGTGGTPSVVPPTTATPPITRTYDLVGGTATLRFSSAGVTVLAASPASGFTVDIGDSHDGGKRVEFESDDHRSRLDAWWDGGPQDEVREDD